ncbi:tetratricopeptide repeat protein, partial [candidate division KSB1 bacterium]|nr:tetratricopeptide repeat protein [candidate division KSB1 bacterium]
MAQTQQQNNNRIRLAQNYERQGKYDAALRLYLNLFNQVHTNQLYYQGVKRNMLRLNMYDQLVAIIESQIRRTTDPRYHADLGDVYYRKGNHDKASEIWQQLLETYSTNRSVYSYVANAMTRNRLYDEAIKVYKLGRQKLGRDDTFVFELANLYVLRLNFKAATLEYLGYLEKHPNQFGYIENRIANYTKEPEDALQVAELLKASLETTTREYLVRKLLADLYLRVEEYGKSLREFQVLERMDAPERGKTRSTGQELYFFAEKALQAGEFKFAQQAYDLILDKYPSSPFKVRASYGLARAKQMQGFANEAIQAYEALIATAPQNPWSEDALFQIGEIYFADLFEVDKALDTFKSLVEKYPGGKKTLDTYFRIGDCLTAKGNFADARTWYEKPLDAGKTNWVVKDRALYKTAYLDFMRGEYDPALERLNRITEDMQKKTASDQNYVNDALELIILIEENKKKADALSAYAQAQQFRLQRKYSEAIDKLQGILKNFPSAGIVDEALLDLGELENSRGNHAAAIDY